MNLLRTLLAYLAYLAIRLLGLLYALIPANKAYALGASFAACFYPLFRKRRRIAVDNILQAHITNDPAEADHIARKAFGHFAGHLCEALKSGRVIGPDTWREHITFDGPDTAWKLLMESPGVPVMILTGHLGAWESAVSIISFTRPMIAVARKMNNPFVERFLKKHHFRGEITIVPKKRGFAPSVLREWKEKGAAMTLLMDQHAGPKHGIRVNFMGHPASTHTSPARLHLKTGAPILAGAFVRDGLFQYRMVTAEPIRFTPTRDKEKDVADLTAEINRRIEAVIRRYPEQYLWAHKRWR
ncbi:MAG: lysophospholipid acyltransferase family protein [bacterium]